MKKIIGLLVLVILVSGCATIWNNPKLRTAYYTEHGITKEMQEHIAKDEWVLGMNPVAVGLIFGCDVDKMQRVSFVFEHGNILCYKFHRGNCSYYFYFTNGKLAHWSKWNNFN